MPFNFSLLSLMSARSKMAQKAKRLNKNKKEITDEPMSLDFKRFTLSVLMVGTNPKQALFLMLLNNIRAPSPATFYRIQRSFIMPLFLLAWTRIRYYQTLMGPESVLCFDGAWSHPRNAKQCIVSAVDNQRAVKSNGIIRNFTNNTKMERQ